MLRQFCQCSPRANTEVSCALLPKIEQWRSRGRGGDSREQAHFKLFTSQSLNTLMSDRAVARYSNEDWKCSQDEL